MKTRRPILDLSACYALVGFILAARAGQSFHPPPGAGARPARFRPDRALHWARRLAALCVSVSLATSVRGGQTLDLRLAPQAVRLGAGGQVWRFTRVGETWALDAVEVRGVDGARPLSREDSFFVGGGAARSFTVVTNGAAAKAVAFQVGANRVSFSVRAADRLPSVRVRMDEPATATFALRSVQADAAEHGAWVTRGYVAADADGHEDFVDASNPLIFGHNQTGDRDACYLFVPVVHAHIQPNGRIEQRSDTWFQSARRAAGGGRFYGDWRLRLGRAEPKEFAAVFDRDLGGRISDVCEKYYADAVDTLVDVAAKIAYPETKDPADLAKADRICDWFASYLADESKLNFLQGDNRHDAGGLGWGTDGGQSAPLEPKARNSAWRVAFRPRRPGSARSGRKFRSTPG